MKEQLIDIIEDWELDKISDELLYEKVKLLFSGILPTEDKVADQALEYASVPDSCEMSDPRLEKALDFQAGCKFIKRTYEAYAS